MFSFAGDVFFISKLSAPLQKNYPSITRKDDKKIHKSGGECNSFLWNISEGQCIFFCILKESALGRSLCVSFQVSLSGLDGRGDAKNVDSKVQVGGKSRPYRQRQHHPSGFSVGFMEIEHGRDDQCPHDHQPDEGDEVQ